MSESEQNDSWQVDVNGQVYEASFAELADWIADGALQPDDKVRRGNLRWIEARKVPTLTPFFNAKANGSPPPSLVISTTDASEPDDQKSLSQIRSSSEHLAQIYASMSNLPDVKPPIRDPYQPQANHSSPFGSGYVRDHVERPAVFVCRSCSRPACRECVNSFGSSVAVCQTFAADCASQRADLETDQRKEEFRL